MIKNTEHPVLQSLMRKILLQVTGDLAKAIKENKRKDALAAAAAKEAAAIAVAAAAKEAVAVAVAAGVKEVAAVAVVSATPPHLIRQQGITPGSNVVQRAHYRSASSDHYVKRRLVVSPTPAVSVNRKLDFNDVEVAAVQAVLDNFKPQDDNGEVVVRLTVAPKPLNLGDQQLSQRILVRPVL